MPNNSEFDEEYDEETEEQLEATAEATAREAKEREALLEERRNRQMGTKKKPLNRAIIPLLATSGIATILLISFGYEGIMSAFGFETEQAKQMASTVNLDVERPKTTKAPKLDFIVEAPKKENKAEPEEEIDPNEELKKKFAALEAQLKKLAASPQESEVSLKDMQAMLKNYNENLQSELEKQRQEMQEQNEELRAKALELEEKRQAEEEEKKISDEQRAEAAALEKLQSTSPGIVIDEGQTTSSIAAGTSAASTSTINTTNNSNSAVATDQSGGPTQSENEMFLAAAASSEFQTSVSQPLADPSRTVVQGTIISGVLETAINTELPGNIRGQVMEPVFSFDGKNILMPAGTVLIGTFNSNIQVAQKRVLIAWNRAITPNGDSVALGGTGADVLGRSGTGGNVDGRFMQKFGAAALISTITLLPSMVSSAVSGGSSTGSDSGTTINIGGDSSSDSGIASALTGAAQESSSGVLNEYLSLPPIIRVPQGEEIRVFVNRDLLFQ